jgi:hypothetical protein
MSRRNKKNNRKNRKGKKVSVHRGPSMQGMQQVDTWDLIDVVPIVLNNQGVSSTPTDPYVLQAGFNANGWFYEVK